MTLMCLKVVVHTPSFSSCFGVCSALCMKYCSVSKYFTHALALTIFVTSRKRCNTHTHAFNLSEILTGSKSTSRTHTRARVSSGRDLSRLPPLGDRGQFSFSFSLFFLLFLLVTFLFLFLFSFSFSLNRVVIFTF